MLRHLHVVRGSNHYRYYLDTDRLLEKNESAIVNWCKEVRRDLSEGDKKMPGSTKENLSLRRPIPPMPSHQHIEFKNI